MMAVLFVLVLGGCDIQKKMAAEASLHEKLFPSGTKILVRESKVSTIKTNAGSTIESVCGVVDVTKPYESEAIRAKFYVVENHKYSDLIVDRRGRRTPLAG
jgi:hypothetical protein